MRNKRKNMSEKAKKWSDEAVAKLTGIVGDASPVSVAFVQEAADALDVTVRSVASKLRKLGYEVESMAKDKISTFTEDESNALVQFIELNQGAFTYREIAEQFNGGQFSPKQIQGKILALELTGSVKATEKVEVANKYSVDEEAIFVDMANKGKFIEEIAEALDRPISSIRGKALSLIGKGAIAKIPTQRHSTAKDTVDPLDALGDAVAEMTVAEIAAALDKTERGIKTTLTRRGVTVADYDGAAKRAKAEAKAETTKQD